MSGPGPTRVRVGLALGAFAGDVPRGRELAGLARGAEGAGFDSLHVGDHVQWHAPIHETTVLMATFAAATERVRIVSDVIVLPFRHPVLLAKTIASLDVLSGGRLTLGVGVGGDYAPEYAAMGVPIGQRGARADETLEILRGLFAQERLSYAGRYFTIEDVGIAPRPLQQPFPVWVGGTSPGALRRAARFGSGCISVFASERKFARLAADLQGLLAERGRPAASLTLGSFLFVHVDPDRSRARARAAHHVDEVYRLPGETIVDRFGAAGPVEACVERVRAYVEAGAAEIVLYPLCDPAEWPRQLDGLAAVAAQVKGGT
jgi:probable F420-dependent oxidoreductase